MRGGGRRVRVHRQCAAQTNPPCGWRSGTMCLDTPRITAAAGVGDDHRDARAAVGFEPVLDSESHPNPNSTFHPNSIAHPNSNARPNSHPRSRAGRPPRPRRKKPPRNAGAVEKPTRSRRPEGRAEKKMNGDAVGCHRGGEKGQNSQRRLPSPTSGAQGGPLSRLRTADVHKAFQGMDVDTSAGVCTCSISRAVARILAGQFSTSSPRSREGRASTAITHDGLG